MRVSLAGLWPRLPELPHKIVLGCSVLPFSPPSSRLARVRWPTREEAIRRVEGVSGVQHRPASSYEDTLTLGAEDARTAALWKAHRQRLAALLARLRVAGPPRAPTATIPLPCARSPARRFVLIIVVGDSAADRLWSAFRFSPLAKGAEARLDAWITPPAYTGKPPIMLADGAASAARAPPASPPAPWRCPTRAY